MFVAFFMSKMQVKGKKEINRFWKLFIVMAFALLPIVLIMLEPDNGTAISYMMAFLFMIYVSGIDKKYI